LFLTYPKPALLFTTAHLLGLQQTGSSSFASLTSASQQCGRLAWLPENSWSWP